MKEYIMPIDDTAFDWDEMFVGVIRKQEELTRCKDCKWWNTDEDECWLSGLDTDGYEYCSWAERKEA